MSFFAFPEDGHWDEAREAIVFTIMLGAYEGEVRVPRAIIRRLADHAVTPEQCVEYYFLQRTRFERAAEAKLRRRELDEDANITLTGRDMREERIRLHATVWGENPEGDRERARIDADLKDRG